MVRKELLFGFLIAFIAASGILAADGRFTAPATAEGDILILTGRVIDTSGRPVPGAAVEIWQTDAKGVYDHPGDSGTGRRDRNFQFFGTAVTDDTGRYAFRTILPGRYEPRPRHIHTKVRVNERTVLTSQIYFAVDGESRGVGGSARNLMIDLDTRFTEDGKAYRSGDFDFVIDLGERGTLSPTDRQSEGPYYPVENVSAYDNDLANVG